MSVAAGHRSGPAGCAHTARGADQWRPGGVPPARRPVSTTARLAGAGRLPERLLQRRRYAASASDPEQRSLGPGVPLLLLQRHQHAARWRGPRQLPVGLPDDPRQSAGPRPEAGWVPTAAAAAGEPQGASGRAEPLQHRDVQPFWHAADVHACRVVQGWRAAGEPHRAQALRGGQVPRCVRGRHGARRHHRVPVSVDAAHGLVCVHRDRTRAPRGHHPSLL